MIAKKLILSTGLLYCLIRLGLFLLQYGKFLQKSFTDNVSCKFCIPYHFFFFLFFCFFESFKKHPCFYFRGFFKGKFYIPIIQSLFKPAFEVSFSNSFPVINFKFIGIRSKLLV